MTALASIDVTVTVNPRDKDIGHGALSKFMGIASLSFGDGALTYPTGGIPLPAIGRFGLLRQVDIGVVEPPPGDGYVYKYDRANHKIRIYGQGVTTGSTAASTSANGVLAEDENGAETAVRLYGAVVDTDYNLGALHEVGAGFAPSATTLKMLLVGE
jgi:hypothetical protein